uniref:Adaptor protein ClpS core domain-containing protein n=1 Tax=Rhodosorus marinus TaxID=101924 RepID=A0A7S0FZA3_9RHOD|mmetsp:Transcript_13354/g.19222  ORF Transcript_13354/g.19222 Transcript_13354/m.19222 type:complete len:134 (+) Transcript_13354:239-640(+)
MAFVGPGVGLLSKGRADRRVVRSLGGGSQNSPLNPGAGPSTVLERPTQTQKGKIDPGKRYKVIVFGENGQTRDFIAQVLMKCLPGMREETAKEIADKAKKAGKAVVGAWIFEMAEAYCDSLRSSGLVADIQLE